MENENIKTAKKKGSTISSLLAIVVLFTIFIVVYIYKNEITRYILINVVYKKEMVILEANQYEKKLDYNFVQSVDEYVPNNKQELMNVIYTILDKGWKEFTFYCPMEYETCLDDLDELIENPDTLSDINNFVHPYNSFDKLYITKNAFGKIHLEIEKTYSDLMIQESEKKVDEILNEMIKDDMTNIEKIRTIHDYIINHTTYDEEHAQIIETGSSQKPAYASNTAYGALIDGKAICGGYSDSMSIFLNRLGMNNYKISSNNHVWNYVYLDGKWYHLDLTWDDPVVTSGRNILLHNFFLISTSELLEKDVTQHRFNLLVYSEK